MNEIMCVGISRSGRHSLNPLNGSRLLCVCRFYDVLNCELLDGLDRLNEGRGCLEQIVCFPNVPIVGTSEKEFLKNLRLHFSQLQTERANFTKNGKMKC